MNRGNIDKKGLSMLYFINIIGEKMFYLPLDEFKKRIRYYKFIRKIDNIFCGIVDKEVQSTVMIFSSKEEFEGSKINFTSRIVEKEMELNKKKYYRMARKDLGLDYTWRVAEAQMRPILELEQKLLIEKMMDGAKKLEDWQPLYMVRQNDIISFPEFRQDCCKLLTTDFEFANDFKHKCEEEEVNIVLGRKFIIQEIKPRENKSSKIQIINDRDFIKNNSNDKKEELLTKK